MGGHLRSSQVIGRSLELQLGAEQRARSRAEAEARALGAHRVRAAGWTPSLEPRGGLGACK